MNAPILGILTVRTPPALRPKVMSAVMTVALLAGPLGFLLAGQAISRISIYTLFLIIAAALTAGSCAFAAILLRHRATVSLGDSAAADFVAVPGVAHGEA